MSSRRPVAGMGAELAPAVAAYGVGGSTVDLPKEPLDARGWRLLLDQIRGHRLSGFLTAAVGDGALGVTPEQWDEANETHVQAMCLALLLENTLIDAVDVLDRAGIDHRVL